MSDNIVYATGTLVTEHNGRPVHMTRGEAWDADDAFVKANPDLFGGPTEPRRTSPKRRPAQATETAARRGPSTGSGRVTR